MMALLYISTVALMGTFGEVFVGNLYHAIFNQPLWTYTVYPIHNGYTSYFAPFIWGSYGFYLYLAHGTLKSKKVDKEWHLAAIFGIETIVAEIVVNGMYKLVFNEYLFYYTPGDL